MSRQAPYGTPPRQVSILAIPNAMASTLVGLFDVLNIFELLRTSKLGLGPDVPFSVEIVAERRESVKVASGISIDVHRSVEEIQATDIVIVPSLLLPPGGWTKDLHPDLVDWLRLMHSRGATLCSACSGIFLLGETGLFDGKDVTVHYRYAKALSNTYPSLRIHPDRVLVITGTQEELISSGASTTWHDLALYLISRYAGSTTAQEVAHFFALQWHQDGLAPYIMFEGRTDHGDSEIEVAQKWLARNFSAANSVEEMIKQSRLAERTFQRRFVHATGLTPLAYAQRLRVEDAKRRLERTEASVDEISWRVGYEDVAFFHRLFKRITGLTPGAYRKRFRIPDFARSSGVPSR